MFPMKANRIILTALLAVAASSPSVAADYGAPPPTLIPGVPVAVAPVDLWTGFYLGASAGMHFDGGAGATYTQSGNFEFAGTRKDLPFDEQAIGGIQGGFLQQFGPIVAGVELSASALAAKGEQRENPLPGNDYHTKAELGPILAAKGRLGFALDRFMVYAAGGYAWSQLDYSASFTSGVDPVTLMPIRTRIDDSFDMHGFVYGGGVEFALGKNVSLGVEYLQYDFGDSDVQTFKVTNSGITAEKLKADLDLATVQARLNFKF
jgi:outer membrane immunogenic protein